MLVGVRNLARYFRGFISARVNKLEERSVPRLSHLHLTVISCFLAFSEICTLINDHSSIYGQFKLLSSKSIVGLLSRPPYGLGFLQFLSPG